MKTKFDLEDEVEITSGEETSIFFWNYKALSDTADALCLELNGSDGVFETSRVDFNNKEELLELEAMYIKEVDYNEEDSCDSELLVMGVFKELKDNFEEYNSFRLSCNV